MNPASQEISFKKVTQEDLKQDDKLAEINRKWSPYRDMYFICFNL